MCSSEGKNSSTIVVRGNPEPLAGSPDSRVDGEVGFLPHGHHRPR